MNEEWTAIHEDYEKAKAALWCPRGKGANGWRRKEEEGRYYMWNAYHCAVASTTQEPLLLARILSMMASETQYGTSDYERYHKYIRPALEAYEKALAAGMMVGEKELDHIRFDAASLAYKFERESAESEEHYHRLQGWEKMEGFAFHDSQPVSFELVGATARLRLKYYDITVTIQFEGIIDLRVSTDPAIEYVHDFYCYPAYHNKDLQIFDAGCYVIMCSRIFIANVQRKET